MVLRCLRSLNASLVQRIVVVDNGSTDGTAAAVRGYEGVADLVRLEQRRSLAAAYNRGAERGSGELVLFLNDDILASDAAIVKLAESLRLQPDAVAAAGRLVDPTTHETQVEYQPRQFPTWRTFVGTFLGTGRPATVLDEATTVAVDQPPGACLLVRRAVFEAIGGWDEQFEFWYEDVDLARRLAEHGPVLYVPTAPFEHVGGWSARRLDRSELVSRHYRGALLYASKHFPGPQRVAAGVLYALVAAARIVLSRRDAQARASYSSVLSSGLRLAAGRRLSRP
jgi:N-acetylglucosaminyl-diphospho-decaprenol L-rhamnosyltransferase